MIVLTFQKPVNVTGPGDDSRSFRFPFNSVTSELIGSPEHKRGTTEHRLIVRATNSRLATWKLQEDDLIKVLFHIGVRAIRQKLDGGDSLQRDENVMVSTVTHPAECPFDPKAIQSPEGAILEIEFRRRIGFQL
jgi:hypothetical protein